MTYLYKPIFASILKNRGICAVISGAAILQLSLVFAGLPGWQSPFHSLLGFPDPGCGLSRAIVALFRGDWQTSLTFHAFAPFFVIALILIALVAIFPVEMKNKAVIWVEVVELRTGLTAYLLIGLVLYWLARLLFMREAFFSIVAS